MRPAADPSLAEVEDRPSRHDELVRANLDPAGNRDGLAFVQDPEAVLFVDGHVLDGVRLGFPGLYLGILLDDQGTQVLGVEHQDVGGTTLGIELHEGGNQDLEGQTQVAGEILASTYLRYIT